MDTSRWNKIQTLFLQALELPFSEHANFLESACQGDMALLNEITAMIEEDHQGETLLDQGLPSTVSRLFLEAENDVPLAEISPYRLKKFLGEGGMGIVWLAEREDTGSPVAIKFLPHANLSPTRRGRFAQEIRTLAALKHPYIARFYDAGSLADGTPWFAMEYVDGVPFTDYCKGSGLAIDARLQILCRVAEAVQYAHGQEIIHRDLKPSNIFVERDGTPKLLDFGIAKQLHRPTKSYSTELRLATPHYSAPEWRSQGKANFSTDVYSLGIVLFEILTEQLPEDSALGGTNIPADLEKPSSLVTKKPNSQKLSWAAKIGSSEWRDLDALCLKATAANPEQRYQSVEAFLRDIHHFLRNEPLEARPDSMAYVAKKFVRRNWRVVSAAALALVLFLCLTVFFTVRLAKERNAALAEAARTARVEKFMEGIFQGGDPSAGPTKDLQVTTLLDRGLHDAQSLHRDPAVQSDLYLTLGHVSQLLGRLDQADHVINQAIELRRSIFGSDSTQLAEGLLAFGKLRSDQGKLPEAERYIRQALEINRKHLPANHPAVLEANRALGTVLSEQGKYKAAIDVLNPAFRLAQSTNSDEEEQARILSTIADSYFYLEDFKKADAFYEQVVAINRRIHGSHHPSIADILIDRGHIQRELGNYPKAETFYRQALEINQAWYGEAHPETADCLGYLAQIYSFEDRSKDAEPMLKRSLEIMVNNYGPIHPRTALVLAALGGVELDLENMSEAERDFQRSAEIYRITYGDRHVKYGVQLSNLASVYFKEKKYILAEQTFRASIPIFVAGLSAKSMQVGVSKIKLGRTLLAERRYQEALNETLSGYEIVKQVAPQSDFLHHARKDLVSEYEAMKQPDKAMQYQAENTPPKK